MRNPVSHAFIATLVLALCLVGTSTAGADALTDQAKAKQGDAGAQVTLGVMYATGEGIPEDDAEAAKWFRKAAEQGDVIAQFNLGMP